MKLTFNLTVRSVLRATPIVLAVGLLVGLPVGYATVEYTTRPEFCRSCHIMEPYVASWEESSHRSVPCVDCHYEPGLLETAEGKFKALSQLAKYVTGTEGTKPWAEVSDASCMRSGCHSTRLLVGPIDFEVGAAKIAFDHAPHLLEMRRSKKLRCTSCHSQIVQGEHIAVTPSTCFLCHFKSAAEDTHLGDCRTCHGPPERTIDLSGFAFRHDDYLRRGVDCKSCHARITRGEGEVPKRRCGSCHAVVEHIERYGETAFLHRTHVTEHNVDCFECHTEMTHQLPPRDVPKENDCATCHRASHGTSGAFYRGEGGRGTPPQPSAMYIARVACSGCHIELPGAGSQPSGTLAASEVACLSCHGPSYDGMVGRWQVAYAAAIEAARSELDAALGAIEGREDADSLRARLDDAVHDLGIVENDGSRGVHNPWYARRLLTLAHARATEVLQTIDAARAPSPLPLEPPFPTELSCATLCHLGIETQAIGLAGTRFDHARHLGRGGLDCDSCHTKQDDHGETLIGADDCNGCHHGEGAPAEATCETCHATEALFLRGRLPGMDEAVQMMAKVECAECHGAPPRGPVLDVVQESCVRCHQDRYEDMLEEWMDYGSEWFEEAEEMLAPLRAKAPAKGGAAAEALARAEAILGLVRRGRPAHNILLFDEQTEAFAEACEDCERALK